MFNIDHILF